jgi:hypothetical protein
MDNCCDTQRCFVDKPRIAQVDCELTTALETCVIQDQDRDGDDPVETTNIDSETLSTTVATQTESHELEVVPNRESKLSAILILQQQAVLHTKRIQLEPSLKDAHVYCMLTWLTAQQFGPLLEKELIRRFRFTKTTASACTGDCSKDNQHVEIKVSLGGKKCPRKFNYVQIRVHHQISYYLLTAYNLTWDNVAQYGELYIFKVPHDSIKALVQSHGSYAHGTIKDHGPINTHDSLNKEYALRPTIGDACWTALLPFRVQENEL